MNKTNDAQDTEPAPSPAPGAAAAPDELDRLAAEAAAVEVPPPDANAAPAPTMPPTKDVLEMVLTPAFALLAPNWNVGKGEIEQLSEAYALVVDKYFPDGLGDFGPEITACLITAAVFAPRLGKPRKAVEKTETVTDGGD